MSEKTWQELEPEMSWKQMESAIHDLQHRVKGWEWLAQGGGEMSEHPFLYPNEAAERAAMKEMEEAYREREMSEYITISLKLGDKELLKHQYLPIDVIPYPVLEELQAAIEKFVLATTPTLFETDDDSPWKIVQEVPLNFKTSMTSTPTSIIIPPEEGR